MAVRAYLSSMTYRLSALDQTPIAEGSTAADALANTLDLARTCDALGYDRYWLAEHHASPGLAGAAPEALIGPVALATRRIRVGSGGIMLPHYSPFKVAETFALLSALAPNRIDLGVGRAPGSDQRTAFALQRDRSKRMPHGDFPNNLAEMIAYLDDAMPADHPFAALGQTLPSGGGETAVWLLGSSSDSAVWAAEAGLPYCIADFINSDAVPLARLYRERFKPSARLAKPYLMVATWAIAAPTRAEAVRLALPAAMMMAHLIRGELIPVPSVEKAERWAAANPASPQRRRITLGTPAEVHTELDKVAADYGADEMMLVNIMPDHAARRRSYELVAAEYGLAALAKAA
ncbi:LLM class flavin-dependent oxidoreductase [Sphingomonas sp.]|uniref:LLM class flavin-dependent oxidoreductase n=1 Tax=Sphingomonas sp. TaxID=28214 RepID=UPI0025DAEC6F|nr:LLM class flavin-dependent oxidoreductase [Sphingomonas sp.]